MSVRTLLPLVLIAPLAMACEDKPCNRNTDPECVYRFAMIKDVTPLTDLKKTGTDGADIYGVVLFHQMLTNPILATQVHACGFGPGNNSLADDCNYTLSAGTSTCGTTDYDYTALGGKGGYVIVNFGGEIIDTDDIVRVYECDAGDNDDDYDEDYQVYVGVSSDPNDPSWFLCGETTSGLTDCTVNLDE